MKAGIYIRVSTAEQRDHGISVDSQEKALREYCEENGYEVAKIYNDAGLSASKSYKHRPALLQMLQDCQTKQIDILLFTKLDRFFRNVPDYYACVEQMNSVPWKAIWEDYETVTSSGKFKVNIMLSIAQAESDRTSERIKAVKEYQRSTGAFVGGTAPFGYRINKSELMIDPETKATTEKIFEIFLQTKNVSDVLDYLRSIGISRSRHGVYHMLKHTVYAGDYNGYKCDSYITWEQHQEIVNSLEKHSKGRRTRTKEIYLFSGLVRCPVCDRPMISCFSARNRSGVEKHYIYYFCNGLSQKICTNRINLSERKLEKYLIESLDKEYELYKLNVETTELKQQKDNNELKIKQLESKLTRLANLYEDGDIEREDYRAKRDSIKREILDLKSIITPVSKDLPSDWLTIYNELDKTHKKQFWNNIIDVIYVYKDGVKIKL